jgi:hypothetical protein
LSWAVHRSVHFNYQRFGIVLRRNSLSQVQLLKSTSQL